MRVAVLTVCCAAGMLGACADTTAPAAAPGPFPPQVAIPPGPYVAGQSYFGRSNYIEYLAGNAPVILSAPHGGNLTPAEIPDRTASACGGTATTTTDLNTRELTLAMRQRFFARFGTYPHVVINHLHRRKLDANRAVLEAACNDAEAQIAWTEFHDFLGVARDAVLATAGKGWYMDMHGHGHSIQRLELGYLLSGAQLRFSDATLDGTVVWQDSSSINTLSAYDTQRSFSAVLRGTSSLGSLYANHSFPSVPSSSDAAPQSGDSYFSGGYNTERYGCSITAGRVGGISAGNICGVQIEANYTGVRDTEANRTRFAEVTATVLEEYLRTHWDILLLPGGGNTAPSAGFTHSCSALSCSFTDTSTDSDGSVVAWSWTFGDGGTSSVRNPAHSYAAAGTYSVQLVVTDDGSATGTVTNSVTVTTAASGITLGAVGYKVQGVQRADLSWSGATGTAIDIVRSGVVVATTTNDGSYTDNIGKKGGGSYTYRVCQAGTSTCSNAVTVTF